MNLTILSEYRRMRQAGVGGIVGQDARICLDLARARAQYLEREDVQISHEPEYESYRDAYGDDPPEGAEFVCVVVRIAGEVVASLGFVEYGDCNDYLRTLCTIENELLAEAFAQEARHSQTLDAVYASL